MPDNLAIDYAWSHPDPATIRAAGYFAVIRYLSEDPTKNITVEEAAALHAAGLSVGLIWETTAQAALAGPGQGAADGASAVREAQALGYPGGCVIFANLGDFAGGDSATIQAYYEAFRTVPGFVYQAGGYLTSKKINQMVAGGAQGVWWQNAMDDNGVPGDVVNSSASVYQRVTPTKGLAGDYDEDVILNNRLIFWAPEVIVPLPPAPIPEPAPAPAPAPSPTWTETLMSQLPELSEGATGQHVKNVQGLVVAQGHTIAIDGVFGPITKAAVETVQRAASVGVDGVVGPVTYGVLLGV